MAEFDKRELERDARALEHWCREILPELGTFRAACLYKTRAKAGSMLGKEGQNVGKSITRLEHLLQDSLNGGSFVDHADAKKVSPTEAGEELRDYCEKVASLSCDFLDRLKDLQYGSKIRIAMTDYAWLAYGTALETAYKERRPDGVVDYGGKVYSQDKVWKEIEKEVVEGRADIGVYSFPPTRRKEVPAGLAMRNWIEEEYVLVLPGGAEEKFKGEIVSLRNLPVLPQIVHYDRSLDFDRTRTIEQYLRRQKVRDRFKGDWLFGVNAISEIKNTLQKKGGMSFLPWPTVEQEHNEGKLRAYKLNPPMRPRVMKLIFRLHGSRHAVVDFLKAAASLEGKRTFPG